MFVKFLGSSVHYFFFYYHSRTHRRLRITSQSAWLAYSGKRALYQDVHPISWVFVYVHSYDGVPRWLRVLCPECLTDWVLALSQHALTGQMVQGSHQWAWEGGPLAWYDFGCVYCSERLGKVHRTEFIRASVLNSFYQEHIMAHCNFAYTLSELTVRRAPQNMRCWTIQTVIKVRLSVAAVCRSTVRRFLHCDSPEHCVWRASTSAHKQLWVVRPGATGRYFSLVLQWDPATCAASLFCAGNALSVNAYFR